MTLYFSLFLSLSLCLFLFICSALSISSPISLSVTLAQTRALSYPRDQSLLISLTHMCACVRGRRGDSSPSLLPPLSPSFLLSCAQDGDLSSSVSFLHHLLSTALPNFSSLCPSLFFLHLVLPLFCILSFFSFSPFAMNFSSTLRKVLMHS